MIRVTIEGVSLPFRRILEIENLDGPQPSPRDHSAIHTYGVVLNTPRRQLAESSFEHRYGDDLLTLVSEAIDALGGRGDSMELRR